MKECETKFAAQHYKIVVAGKVWAVESGRKADRQRSGHQPSFDEPCRNDEHALRLKYHILISVLSPGKKERSHLRCSRVIRVACASIRRTDLLNNHAVETYL